MILLVLKGLVFPLHFSNQDRCLRKRINPTNPNKTHIKHRIKNQIVHKEKVLPYPASPPIVTGNQFSTLVVGTQSIKVKQVLGREQFFILS
jgi:hypothetical protein